MPGVPMVCDFCGEHGEYGGRVFVQPGVRMWCRGCAPVARTYCGMTWIEDAERLRLVWRLCRGMRRRAEQQQEIAMAVTSSKGVPVGSVATRWVLEAAGCEVRPLIGGVLNREDYAELYEAICRICERRVCDEPRGLEREARWGRRGQRA